MKTKECPRCNEERMIEWFGDPKAPYAICLSCRVEINGEKAKGKAKRPKLVGRNCAICETPLLSKIGDICAKCDSGLQAFGFSQRVVGRAASYVSGKLCRCRRKPKKLKQRNHKLRELIKSQRKDARDQRTRFEHAIYK